MNYADPQQSGDKRPMLYASFLLPLNRIDCFEKFVDYEIVGPDILSGANNKYRRAIPALLFFATFLLLTIAAFQTP